MKRKSQSVQIIMNSKILIFLFICWSGLCHVVSTATPSSKIIENQVGANADKISKLEQLIKEFIQEIKDLLKPSTKVCKPSPCLNGGKCAPFNNDAGYLCGCLAPYSGTYCQTFDCTTANKCIQFNNKIYTVADKQTTFTWAEAKGACEGRGISMVMPKDEATTKYLVKQLIVMYPTLTTHFWIGLSAPDGQWVWSDGSALGGYTGNNVFFESQVDGQWAALRLNGGSVLWYTEMFYTLNPDYPFLALCEQPMPK